MALSFVLAMRSVTFQKGNGSLKGTCGSDHAVTDTAFLKHQFYMKALSDFEISDWVSDCRSESPRHAACDDSSPRAAITQEIPVPSTITAATTPVSNKLTCSGFVTLTNERKQLNPCWKVIFLTWLKKQLTDQKLHLCTQIHTHIFIIWQSQICGLHL